MHRRGNVLFITVDQWRGDSLSCVGHPLVETPTLDALAADGVLFTKHYANICPCGPSRASLYTGMYAQNHRSMLNGTPLDARFTNVALLAREVGYSPALFGYTDTSVDPRTVAPDDPRLRLYEGVLPGFDPIVNDPELYGSKAWATWLAKQGVDVPDDVRDLYEPSSAFLGPMSTARPGRRRSSPPSTPRPPSWWAS
jgi:arylsulfatase A-like enzyme